MDSHHKLWIEAWKNSKIFQVEKDRIKPKTYLFSSFPKTNLNGFQDAFIRPVLVGDFFSRYLRMKGNNVLFPMGFDSLGLSSYMENKKISNAITDDISFAFEQQMLQLGIGIDNQKKMDLKHEEFLGSLQLAFIELYERGYIKYGDIDVYQDKSGKKILDTYFYKKNLVPNRVKAFYLDISQITESLVKKIDELPVGVDIKKNLLSMLDIQERLTITFAVTNGASMKHTFTEPEYIGAISYILIHPDYIDFQEYTQYEEFQAIELYLSEENTNDFGVFTGNYAINPLTGKKIPIFLSVREDCPIYFANTYLNATDRMLAQEELLSVIDVVQNGVFIESDFLNGLPVEEGRGLIIEQFVKADIAVTESYFSKDKILLSSLDSLGALIPFFIDQEGFLYSLKNHLPFVLSSKFRPVLSDEIDVPGNVIPGSINHIFSSGILSILAILYDTIGESYSIFSKDAVESLRAWEKIKVLTIPADEIFEHVFVPLCLRCIIEKEKKTELPVLFEHLNLVHATFDEAYHKFSKANNNLLDFQKKLEKYSGDAIRLYFLSKPLDQDFIFSETELESIKNLRKSMKHLYQAPFIREEHLKQEFEHLLEVCMEALEQKDCVSYVNELITFFKEYLWFQQITHKEGLLFLKLLYPVCPFLAEEIYHDIYKGKYLISDDGWIT